MKKKEGMIPGVLAIGAGLAAAAGSVWLPAAAPWFSLALAGVALFLMIGVRLDKKSCGYPEEEPCPAAAWSGLLLGVTLLGCAVGEWKMLQSGGVSQQLAAWAALGLAVLAGLAVLWLYPPLLWGVGVCRSKPILFLVQPIFLCVWLLQTFVEFSASSGRLHNFHDLVPQCLMLLFFFYHGRSYTGESSVFLRRARMYGFAAVAVGLGVSVSCLLADFGIGGRVSALPVYFHLYLLAQCLFALCWLLAAPMEQVPDDHRREPEEEEPEQAVIAPVPERIPPEEEKNGEKPGGAEESPENEENLQRVLEDYARKKYGESGKIG